MTTGAYNLLSFPEFSEKKVFIQLWHGSPLKRICFTRTLAQNKEWSRMYSKIDAFLVSSKLEAAMISYSFNIMPTQLKLLGRPRNDCLLTKKSGSLRNIIGNNVKFKNVFLCIFAHMNYITFVKSISNSKRKILHYF